MKAEYKVEDNKVLKVQVEFTFDEIINKLTQGDDRSYDSAMNRIVSKIADRIADDFLINHATEVMAMIDPKQIANMASLNVLKSLRNER